MHENYESDFSKCNSLVAVLGETLFGVQFQQKKKDIHPLVLEGFGVAVVVFVVILISLLTPTK